MVKKKFGYLRSPTLTKEGLLLHFWKAVLSAKCRCASPPEKTTQQAEQLCISLTQEVKPMTTSEAHAHVREAKAALWKAQKQATENQVTGENIMLRTSQELLEHSIGRRK